MPGFVIALIVVFGGLWLIRKFARLKPGQSAAFVQKLSGGAIIALAGLLAVRGQMQVATALFVFGLGLFGKAAVFPGGFKWPGGKSAGQKSKVTTSLLSMELDHDSGDMDGEVLAGPAKGRQLSVLNPEELLAFHRLCAKAKDQSLSLLEAWLDRQRSGWRTA